jgi:hypothetical protein
MAGGGGIEPLSSFPLFCATSLEDLCGGTAYYIKTLEVDSICYIQFHYKPIELWDYKTNSKLHYSYYT